MLKIATASESELEAGFPWPDHYNLKWLRREFKSKVAKKHQGA